jgi:hypothetical protein
MPYLPQQPKRIGYTRLKNGAAQAPAGYYFFVFVFVGGVVGLALPGLSWRE